MIPNKSKFLALAYLISIFSVPHAQTVDTLWTARFSFSGSATANHQALLPDSGFIVTGTILRNPEKQNIMLLRISAAGDTLWTKKYDTGIDNRDEGQSVQVTNDGGFILTGRITNKSGPLAFTQTIVIRTDSNGDALWTRRFSSTAGTPSYILALPDDTFLLLHHQERIEKTKTPANAPAQVDYDLYLTKLDPNGNILWQKFYGGGLEDQGEILRPLTDGGFILTGTTASIPPDFLFRVWLVRFDQHGDTLWTRTLTEGFGSDVIQTQNGDYVITGMVNDNVLMVRTDAQGENLWSKTFGGEGEDLGRSVWQTGSGDLVMAATRYTPAEASSRFWILKTNADGDTIITRIMPGQDCRSGTPTTDGGFILSGSEQGRIILVRGAPGSYRADFSSDKQVGDPPLLVSFTDRSRINFTRPVSFWNWDFQNDGIQDASDQNPQWEFSDPGVYSVKLSIDNFFAIDHELKERLIVVTGAERPLMYQLEDVPDDQGGFADLSFVRSQYDGISAKRQAGEHYLIQILNGQEWQNMDSLAFSGKDIYRVRIATPADSGDRTDGIFNYRVTARLADESFISDTLSGYSVDNLAPPAPQNLRIETISANANLLRWLPSPAVDLREYHVYRFLPGVNPVKIAGISDISYTDNDIQSGVDYNYFITALDTNGNQSKRSNIVSTVTAIENKAAGIPDQISLTQNYPNPFNPITTIEFQIPNSEFVALTIYNIMGQEVKRLIGQGLKSGVYHYRFDGSKLASGIYFYRLTTASGFSQSRKMLLLK